MSHENIFLVGAMGSGKTTIGKALALRSKKTFHDSDWEIRQRTGADISLIFDVEGEAGFRRREKDVVREITALKDIVFATGGGCVLDRDNRRLLAEKGFVIYLRATIDVLWERLRHGGGRPLLDASTEPREVLDTLLKHRGPLYEEVADHIIDIEHRSMEKIVSEAYDCYSTR